MSSRAHRILLAGATGYIGAAVARELVARGREVTAVTRRHADIPGCKTVQLQDPCDRDAEQSFPALHPAPVNPAMPGALTMRPTGFF